MAVWRPWAREHGEGSRAVGAHRAHFDSHPRRLVRVFDSECFEIAVEYRAFVPNIRRIGYDAWCKVVWCSIVFRIFSVASFLKFSTRVSTSAEKSSKAEYRTFVPSVNQEEDPGSRMFDSCSGAGRSWTVDGTISGER